jgi:hypothetical protein
MSARIPGLAGRWAIEIGLSGGRVVDDEWGEDRVKRGGAHSSWVDGQCGSAAQPVLPERVDEHSAKISKMGVPAPFLAWQPIGFIRLFPGF